MFSSLKFIYLTDDRSTVRISVHNNKINAHPSQCLNRTVEISDVYMESSNTLNLQSVFVDWLTAMSESQNRHRNVSEQLHEQRSIHIG